MVLSPPAIPTQSFTFLGGEDEDRKPDIHALTGAHEVRASEEDFHDEEPDDDELEAEGDSEIDDSEGTRHGDGTSLFNIQNRIKRGVTTSKTIEELYAMICDGTINMNPSYQRDAVWPQPRQLGLIDSIFTGAAIPALVFAVTMDADGQEHRNVIDGKQRLTTIKRFMDGEFAYRHKLNTGNKSFFWKIKAQYANRATSFHVPEQEKRWFEETLIPCIEFNDIPLQHEEDIFTRIQQGMVLAGGEKNAVGDTPRRQFIRELVKTYFRNSTSPVPGLINIDITRKRDFTDLSAFVYCCEELPNERAKPTHDARLKWLDRTDDVPKAFRKRIYDAMDDFWRIVRQHGHPFTGISQRVAPVEFCYIGVYLFATHDQGISDETRANEILEMRRKVHDQFKGVVKMNSTLFQWWWIELDRVAVRPELADERLPDLVDPMESAPANGARQRKLKAKRDAAAAATMAQFGKVEPEEMDIDPSPSPLPAPTITPRQPRNARNDAGPSTQKRRRQNEDDEGGVSVFPIVQWEPKTPGDSARTKKTRRMGDEHEFARSPSL